MSINSSIAEVKEKSNTLSTRMKDFYQYVRVLLSNGVHEFSYHIYLPCANSTGLTQQEIKTFLIDCHDMREDDKGDDLPNGMYRTHSETACSVFPANRDRPFSQETSICRGDSLETLFATAPELFYH